MHMLMIGHACRRFLGVRGDAQQKERKPERGNRTFHIHSSTTNGNGI
jgi:hypothetical protein